MQNSIQSPCGWQRPKYLSHHCCLPARTLAGSWIKNRAGSNPGTAARDAGLPGDSLTSAPSKHPSSRDFMSYHSPPLPSLPLLLFQINKSFFLGGGDTSLGIVRGRPLFEAKRLSLQPASWKHSFCLSQKEPHCIWMTTQSSTSRKQFTGYIAVSVQKHVIC